MTRAATDDRYPRRAVPCAPAAVAAVDRAPALDRPLRIGLLNLMPDKPATEAQFARLLGAGPHAVELVRFIPDGYRPRHTPAAHIARFYRRWSEVRGERLDGLIVTGAPIETLPFEQVTYWRELTEIFDWARASVRRSYYVCWAAQAALYHHHGVPKHVLPAKLFGVFAQRVRDAGPDYLEGFGAAFPVPVSRHSEVREAELPAGAGLRVLAGSPESGPCLIADDPGRALYMFNHLEYDAGTLDAEYRRDAAAGRDIAMPRNYYPNDDPARAPADPWRPFAARLFRNWLEIIARDVRREAGAAQALGWLFARPRPVAPVGPARAEVLVVGGDDAGILPAVLRGLAEHGLSARAVRPRGGGCDASVGFRLDGIDGPAAERIARRLAALPDVRRVVYRSSDGAGGTFAGGRARLTAPRRDRIGVRPPAAEPAAALSA